MKYEIEKVARKGKYLKKILEDLRENDNVEKIAVLQKSYETLKKAGLSQKSVEEIMEEAARQELEDIIWLN